MRSARPSEPQATGLEPELAARLWDTWVLDGASVIDASAGDGMFLSHLLAAGELSAIAFGSDRGKSSGRHPSSDQQIVEWRATELLSETEVYEVDLVLLRHVLRFSADPVALLTGVASRIRDPHHCLLYIEETAAPAILQSSIWHMEKAAKNFFSAGSLAWLLNRLGYGVSTPHPSSAPSTGDGTPSMNSLLVFDARFSGVTVEHAGFDMLDRADVMQAGAAMAAQRDYWQSWLEMRSLAGREVVVWGLGEASSTFCTVFADSPALSGVIDPSGRNTGMYQGGSGLPVLSPQQLRDDPPDEVLVARTEDLPVVSATVRGLGLDVQTVMLC